MKKLGKEISVKVYQTIQEDDNHLPYVALLRIGNDAPAYMIFDAATPERALDRAEKWWHNEKDRQGVRGDLPEHRLEDKGG